MTRTTIDEHDRPIPMISGMHHRHLVDLVKRCRKYRYRNRHRYRKARRRIEAWMEKPA